MFVMLPGSGGTGVSQASGSGVVYTFAGNCDFVGQVDSNTNGASNVASTIRTYEADRDLIDIIENKWGGTTVSKYDYVNDANARRTKVANTGTAFSTNRFSLWGYNDRSELTSAKRYDCNTSGSCLTDSNTNSPVSGQQFTYDFDNIGNRTQDTGDPDANTTGYTANNLNQYTATTSPTESFTYDNDGNLTQDALWDYTWDAENRLTAITARNPTSGSKKLTFDYDHMNRRWRKRVYTWNTFGLGFWNSTPSVDRKFVYDGWNLIEELNGLSSDAIISRYTWGLDLSGQSGSASVAGTHGAGGIGGLLAMNDNSGSKNYIYFYNANGDVGQLMDVAGGTSAPAVKYEYYPYGGELLASGLAALVSPFRFSTKYWDAETQNLYYGERYLRPKMGRWLCRDAEGEQHGPLLLAALENQPCNLIDSHGNSTDGPRRPGRERRESEIVGDTPSTRPTPEKPAGRGATCDITIKRSAICTLSPQLCSDFGHEWISGGGDSWDYPRDYATNPCHQWDIAHPVWEWNAHVRYFGGHLPDGGPSCGKATCSQIKKCLTDAEKAWEHLPYDFWKRNCLQFVDFALTRCCMAKGLLPTRIPGIGEEQRLCCERAKQPEFAACRAGTCKQCRRGPQP